MTYKSSKIFNLICLLSFLLTSAYALAQEYIIPEQGQVKANISDKGINRISVENDRIAQVIGNEEEYIIESDANLGQIFLTPALKSTKEISLRLITEREKTIDAKFLVKELEPQTISFKYKKELDAPIYNTNSSYNSRTITPSKDHNQESNNQNQKIIEAIKLVNSNKLKSIDLPSLSCLNHNKNLKGVKLVKANQYSFANQMLVIKAEVVNKNKTSIYLKEQDFGNCMRFTNAVALTKSQLESKDSSIIYLVGKDGK